MSQLEFREIFFQTVDYGVKQMVEKHHRRKGGATGLSGIEDCERGPTIAVLVRGRTGRIDGRVAQGPVCL